MQTEAKGEIKAVEEVWRLGEGGPKAERQTEEDGEGV